jgi:GTP-binding protein EngB required for normal cell division
MKGKTQTLNFFEVQHTNRSYTLSKDLRKGYSLAGVDNSIGRPLLYLVDMPGYGFAEVPPIVSYQWREMILKYLTERPR